MTLPLFKDFDKAVQDIFKDDFDSKYSIKIKTAAPYKVSLTQTTEFDVKGGKTALVGKVSAKYAHGSGFSIDKFEVKSNGSIATESSLTGVYPGVKFEFKGNDAFQGDFGLIYKCSKATVTAEVDLVDFSAIRASALTAAGPVNVGASAELKTGEKSELSSFDVAASYAVNNVFVGLKTSDKFAKYGASVSFAPNSQYTLAGLLSFTPEKSAFSAEVAATFAAKPDTFVKAKANDSGVVALSVKQSLAPATSVVGAVSLDIHDPSALKLGLAATLG